MQQAVFSTPVAKCETLARHTVAAIGRYIAVFSPVPEVRAELEALAMRIGSGSEALLVTQAAYRERVLALIGPRVEVKMVDLKADDVVRSVKRSAEEARVADKLFPFGVTPIVKPVGQTEVDELLKLEERFSGVANWPEHAAARARIAGIRAEYTAALNARRDAISASGSARALRNATKEEFLDLYSSAIGAVRMLFPRDRATQDVFFDALRTADDDAADETEPPAS